MFYKAGMGCTPLIVGLGRQKQEESSKFKAILVYMMSFRVSSTT